MLSVTEVQKLRVLREEPGREGRRRCRDRTVGVLGGMTARKGWRTEKWEEAFLRSRGGEPRPRCEVRERRQEEGAQGEGAGPQHVALREDLSTHITGRASRQDTGHAWRALYISHQ